MLDDDDVIDFMITEAISVKALKEEADAQKKTVRDEWKQDKSGLDKLRSIAG